MNRELLQDLTTLKVLLDKANGAFTLEESSKALTSLIKIQNAIVDEIKNSGTVKDCEVTVEEKEAKRNKTNKA